MNERTKVALSQIEYDKYIDQIKTCGANRGPHDYIAITWVEVNDKEENIIVKEAAELMCRVCFSRVKVELLRKEFDEIKLPA